MSHTNRQSRPWWQAEMSRAVSVGEVVVWNRTDCCGDRLSDFWVMVSDKPFASNDLDTLLADGSVTAKRVRQQPSPSVRVDFGGVNAKYVRVQLNGTGYLALAEIEVAPR